MALMYLNLKKEQVISLNVKTTSIGGGIVFSKTSPEIG